MPLAPDELARLDHGKLELRPTPLRVRWALPEVLAADGHSLRCEFAASIRPLPESVERRLLQEVLLAGHEAISAANVAAHFTPALRSEAATTAAELPGARWVEGDGKTAMSAALRRAADAVAFSCGVELLPPFDLQLDSPSLQQQRIAAVQQSMAEQRAAGQLEHLQRSSELLKQFHQLRQAAPELSAGHVLQQVSPADRGPLLETLLLASSQREADEALWAVAGPSLVRIDARDGPPKTQLIELPASLGPLRSVQPGTVEGRRVLLVGARSGFLLVHPDTPQEARPYRGPPVESQLGFSRVLVAGDGLGFWACHGEAGLVHWDAAKDDGASSVIAMDRLAGEASTQTRSAGPRNLQSLGDGWLVFSVGNRLMLASAQSDLAQLPIGADAEIIAIVPDDRRFLVVHEDGTVCVMDRATRALIRKERRGGRITAAGALPWLGGKRLLLAEQAGPIHCVGFDDPLVTQYLSPHHALRVVCGSSNFVAALSADRQRVLLWNPWEGREPIAELYLGGMARHRIADLDFG